MVIVGLYRKSSKEAYHLCNYTDHASMRRYNHRITQVWLLKIVCAKGDIKMS